MTSLTRIAAPANELPGLILAAAVATVGALVILGSRNPVLLLAAPIAGIGLIFAARRPLLAVVLMVAIEVTNVSGVLAPRSGIPFFPASLLMGLLAVGFALRDPNARSRLNGWTMVCAGILVLFLATQAVASVGSVDVAASLTSMRRVTLDCFFVMLVLVLTQLTARPWVVAAAIVVPLAILSSLTVINELIFGGGMSFGGFAAVAFAQTGQSFATARYGGPLTDSNFWGRYLVMALPLAAALLTRALRSGRRSAVAIWMPMIAALFAGIYLTQSRGTFATAGVVIAVWFLACERSVRRRGVAVLPLTILAFAVPGVGNRLVQTVIDLLQARENYNIDSSTLGRVAAQEMALKMFADRPYFGFGPSSFYGQVANFAGRVPTATRNPTGAPHNMYFEFAGETGIVGLLGLAVLLLGFLTVVVLRIVAEPRSSDRVLAAAVCAAIIAYSVASIALHMAYFRAFGVVLALAGGLAPALPLSVDVVPRFLRGVVAWMLAGILGFFAFWLCLWASSSPAVTATQRVTLIPEGPIAGYYAYALDIRSRVEFLPTFANILHDPGLPVSVTADPVRGVLTFTTTADTADNARDQIQRAAAHAGTALHTSIGYQQYSLRTVGDMQISPAQKRSQFALSVAGGVGVGTALMAGLALPRVLAKRRKDVQPARPPNRDLASV